MAKPYHLRQVKEDLDFLWKAPITTVFEPDTWNYVHEYDGLHEVYRQTCHTLHSYCWSYGEERESLMHFVCDCPAPARSERGAAIVYKFYGLSLEVWTRWGLVSLLLPQQSLVVSMIKTARRNPNWARRSGHWYLPHLSTRCNGWIVFVSLFWDDWIALGMYTRSVQKCLHNFSGSYELLASCKATYIVGILS